jgi:hypothetical protein
VSKFTSLKRFTLRAEDDDGFADMDEVRTVLDNNADTLTHLTLGAYLARAHSWDSAFGSPTIQHLTQLELVDTRISDVVLARIAHAHNLVSLTLHGTLDMPAAATAIFCADHVSPAPDSGMRTNVISAPTHVFLPHLEVFRFALVGHEEDLALYGAVVQFLRARPHLRRLDLGTCPWDLVRGLLPELTGLRVLRVRIANLTSFAVGALIRGLPWEMHAIHLACAVSDRPLVCPVSPHPRLVLESEIARVCTGVCRLRSAQHAPLAWHVHTASAAVPHAWQRATAPDGRMARACAQRRSRGAEHRLCRLARRALRRRPTPRLEQFRCVRRCGRRGEWDMRGTQGATRPSPAGLRQGYRPRERRRDVGGTEGCTDRL